MFLRELYKHFLPLEHKNTIILAVDNNSTDLNFISRVVVDHGYNILKCSVASEGLEVARLHKPDLIIFDFYLPDMLGVEFCKQLKANEATKNIPVIVLTKFNTSQFIFDAYENEIDNYLVKPFGKKLLLKLIEEALRDSQKPNIPRG